MEQGFPPGKANIDVSVILMHVGLLLALLGAIAGFFIQLRRETTLWNLAAWGVGGVALTMLSISMTREIVREHPETAIFANGLMILVALTCLAGFTQSLFRLWRDGQANPVFWVLTCLLLLVLTIPILMPAVPQAREAARRTQCKNNLKQIGLALHNYHDEHNEFPPTAQGTFPVSWRVQLLPYIDQAELYKAYDVDQPWNQPPNDALMKSSFAGYACPSVPSPYELRFTAYVAPTGNDTIMRPDRSLPIREILKGTANTLIVVEACGLEIPWPEPRDFDMSKQPVGINLRGKGKTDSPGVMSSYHYGGVHVAAADGSVRLLSQKTDPKVLKQLLSASDGE